MSRSILLLLVGAVLGAVPASAALNVYGLRADGVIVRFKANTPNIIEATITPIALQNGEKLVAIAFEQRTGILFGFGLNKGLDFDNDDSGRFYVINQITGEVFALQGGMDQDPVFTGLKDQYSDDPCLCSDVPTDASYGMRVLHIGTDLFASNSGGDALTLSLSDLSAVHNVVDVGTKMPVGQGQLFDRASGLGTGLVVAIDTAASTLELQVTLIDGSISVLVDPFDGTTPESVHVGFDVWEFTGLVSYTQNGVTRLFTMNLKPWWEDVSNDPTLSPVGIIGSGDIPITSLAVLPGSGLIAVGRGDPAGKGVVLIHRPFLDEIQGTFTAFNSGGARVAVGDIDGDGFPDFVAVPGPGPVASVKVFSGEQLVDKGVFVQIPEGFQPAPFGPTYRGGLFAASANLNPIYGVNDEIVVGTGSGRAKFRIIEGGTLIMSPVVTVPGAAYATGGARVGVGLFERIQTTKAAPEPAAPEEEIGHVIVGSGAPSPTRSRVALFDAQDILDAAFNEQSPFFDVVRMTFVVPGFTGPIFVAAADLFDDRDHYIVGRGTGSPTVKVIDPVDIDVAPGQYPRKGTVLNVEEQFQAFGGTVGGARVGAARLNAFSPFSSNSWHTVILVGTGSGRANRIAARPDSVGDFTDDLFSERLFPNTYTGGVFVAGDQGVRSFGVAP